MNAEKEMLGELELNKIPNLKKVKGGETISFNPQEVKKVKTKLKNIKLKIGRLNELPKNKSQETSIDEKDYLTIEQLQERIGLIKQRKKEIAEAKMQRDMVLLGGKAEKPEYTPYTKDTPKVAFTSPTINEKDKDSIILYERSIFEEAKKRERCPKCNGKLKTREKILNTEDGKWYKLWLGNICDYLEEFKERIGLIKQRKKEIAEAKMQRDMVLLGGKTEKPEYTPYTKNTLKVAFTSPTINEKDKDSIILYERSIFEEAKKRERCPKCNGKLKTREKILNTEDGKFAIITLTCRNSHRKWYKLWLGNICDYLEEFKERID